MNGSAKCLPASIHLGRSLASRSLTLIVLTSARSFSLLMSLTMFIFSLNNVLSTSGSADLCLHRCIDASLIKFILSLAHQAFGAFVMLFKALGVVCISLKPLIGDDDLVGDD